MALCRQIVDFIGFYLTDNANQRTGVGHIPPMQIDQSFIFHVAHPFIQVKMLNPSGVKRGRPAHNAMYFIPFLYQELGQERAILSRYAGNQCYFCHIYLVFEFTGFLVSKSTYKTTNPHLRHKDRELIY